MFTGIFNCLFSWFGGEATRIRRFFVWLAGVVVKKNVYKYFKLSILLVSGRQTTRLQHCKLSLFLIWYSINASTNIFNCLFSCYGGQPTRI